MTMPCKHVKFFFETLVKVVQISFNMRFCPLWYAHISKENVLEKLEKNCLRTILMKKRCFSL